MVDPDRLGRNLKRAREDAGLDQRQAAERAGVHYITLSRWENGRPVKEEALERLAVIYGTTVGALTGKHAVPPQAPPPHQAPDELPRQLYLMALDFEREAVAAGADTHFLRYAREHMRSPELLSLFAGGYDERPMSAEEQQQEFEVVIRELRSLLELRLARQRRERQR